MAGIGTSIQLQDRMSSVLNSITQSMSLMLSTFEAAQAASDKGLGTASMDAARQSVSQASAELIRYREEMEQLRNTPVPEPVMPVWNRSASSPVFMNSGAERFAAEFGEADRMAQQLYQTQQEISAKANSMTVAPAGMQKDLHELESRMQSISARIQQLNQIPVNLRSDKANSELEQLRGQLEKAIESQEDLNISMSRMDISEANEAYRRLNSVLDTTERNIRDNINGQERFNQSIRKGTGAASGLESKLRGVAAGLMAAFSIQKIIQLSDSVTQTTARLNLMNDGLQSTERLNQMIFASAQRARAPYMDTANSIAKMGLNAGNAFNSNAELIAFMEQVNKQFVIGGASAQEQSNAMIQLSQAMAAGALRGEELNSILDAAPGIARTIEQAMGWAEGSIKQYAEKGKVSAQVVKNSLLNMAEETNTKFNSMPMTFSQVITAVQNTLLQTFWPIIQMIGQGATFINENWNAIAPMLYGVAAGIAAAALAWGVYTACQWIATGAAVAFLNTLLANPLFWIAIVIGVIVAAIYRWVQSVGGLRVAWLICVNAVLTQLGRMRLGLLNAEINMQNSIDNMIYGFSNLRAGALNALGNLKASGLMILQGFVNGAIKMINDLINSVNSITGAAIPTISWVADFGSKAVLEEAGKQQQRAADLADLKNKNEKDAKSRQSHRDNLERQLEAERMQRLADLEKAKNSAAAKADEGNQSYGGALEDIAGNTGGAAKDTAAIADQLDIMDEDLKYMRDAAEQEIINRFTLAELKVDVNNNNTLTKQTDFDDMGNYLAAFTGEFLQIAAEGGHI